MKTIDTWELHALIFRETAKQIAMLGDSKYAVPSLSWVKGAFSKDWRDFVGMLKVADYAPSANDCDDFARLAATLAQVCHHRTKGHPTDTGLAFGEIWYQSPQGLHAINVFVFGKDLELGFYEPQAFKVVSLTEEEKNSSIYVRF